MAGYLNASVEILKLARLVGADAEELDYLEQVDAEDIRDLREQVTVLMFEADRQMLQRVAAATRLIPAKLGAVIGERAFGALLCARVTSLLDPTRAVDIANHLPVPFLAELCLHLDPRRASRVIGEMPPKMVAAIAGELAANEEYITMGGFVGHLSRAALVAALDAVDDGDLLRVAYVVESKQSLGALVALLSEERLDDVIRTASSDELWREALDVLSHISEEQRGALGDLAAEQDDEVLASMVRAAQREGLWSDVLPVTRAMSPKSRRRFAKLPAIQTRPVLATIVDAAAEDGLWPELLLLLPLLPAAARRRVAALATSFGRHVFERIVAAAHEFDLWPALIAFSTELDVRPRQDIAKLIDQGEDDLLESLLDAVEEAGLEAELVGVVSQLAAAGQKRLARRIIGLASAELQAALAEAATEADLEILSEALTKRPKRAA
ncbi:MAG: hypothetical protein ACR2KV_15050 [Solirubrobacteraceae bacterium]